MVDQIPRRTVGHHFGEQLVCPQRTWLHYYGDFRDRVPPPPYLRTLQREGLDYEKEIYTELYPHARKISDHPNTRAQETFQAMKEGSEAILQGYVSTEDGEGVIDVLERVGPDPESITGNRYRVGEIKRSETLKTAHALQTAWYTDLMAKAYNQHVDEVFFILGNHQRETVCLGEFWADYEYVKQTLFLTRDNPIPPGPYLTPFCSTCAWRGVCMPELVRKNHLSLIPGISRVQATVLAQQGIQSWLDLRNLTDDNFIKIGLGNFEIEQIRLAIQQLTQGILPLRKSLRNNLLSGVRVVVVDFPNLDTPPHADEPIRATAIYHEGSSGIETTPIYYQGDHSIADLSAFLGNDTFVFYGSTSLSACQRILYHNGGKFKKRPIDILDLVETYLHGPLVNLELENVYQKISGTSERHRLRGEDRVDAVRTVVDWFGKSLV
ncbi:hypothetical protein ANRL1_00450 [Anaerolineae bacterium]|nr:hypothetical protein ANRL1_00450 [Anaerolineae bacterium]